MSNILRVGDTVKWKGSWGSDAPEEAKITGIQLIDATGEKEDEDVTSVPWSALVDRSVTVALDNGHWAYGYQVRPSIQEPMALAA